MDPMEDRDLLVEMVRALVDKPHEVRVDEQRRGEDSHMTVHVNPGDRGKVIGKRGTTIQSLRVLFGRIAAVEKRKIFIQVDEANDARTAA